MKKLAVLALGFISFAFVSAHAAPAPVDLEIVNPSTGFSTETINAVTGLTFTLDIAVQDPTSATTGTQVLGGFDLTLSALPTGLTFNGYSNLVLGFNPGTSNGSLSIAASAPSAANDISIGTGLKTLVQATFTATATGNYTIDFVTPGGFQELSDGSGNSFNYTDIANTVNATVVPEPSVTALCLTGIALLFGFRFVKRASA